MIRLVKQIAVLLCLSTPTLADLDDCIAPDTILSDGIMDFLSEAAEAQREFALALSKEGNIAAATVCAHQALESSNAAADLASLDQINSNTALADIYLTANNPKSAKTHYDAALIILETDLMQTDTEARRFALATLATTLADFYQKTNSNKAAVAFRQAYVWAECGTMFSVGTEYITARLGELKSPIPNITDDLCQSPVTLNALR